MFLDISLMLRGKARNINVILHIGIFISIEVVFMVVVSITLPSDLLKRFDNFIRSEGYYSRSEAFREALRDLMADFQLRQRESENVAATIMVTYEHATRDVTTRLMRLTCEADDTIMETLNRRLGDHHCLTVFVAEGQVRKIRDLTRRIKAMRGIQQINTMLIPTQEYQPTAGKV